MLHIEELKKEIKKIEREMIEVRNEIHKYPELSMKEFKTTNFIIKKLKEFGIEKIKKINDTGVVALIEGNGEKCIALRADIDALPLLEKGTCENKSKIDGVAHCCGHDVHTTCLLGAANILNKHKNEIKGKIKLIFQPAEEIGKGAKYMMENGALKDPIPEFIYGLHCWPGVEAGKVFHRSGKMSASSDTFKILIEGKQGHGAHPYKAIDPIIIAGNIICGVQSLISREISPLESAVITFATLKAGTASNIIPRDVEITGTIRTLSEDIRSYVHKRLEEIINGISVTYRGKAKLEIEKGTSVVFNDEKISKLIQNTCEEVLGKENVIYNPDPSMGSEDFGYYLDEIPGAMFRLGCGYKDKENYPLHSDLFNANEEAIFTGILILSSVAFKVL